MAFCGTAKSENARRGGSEMAVLDALMMVTMGRGVGVGHRALASSTSYAHVGQFLLSSLRSTLLSLLQITVFHRVMVLTGAPSIEYSGFLGKLPGLYCGA